jgi:hypothetical protein
MSGRKTKTMGKERKEYWRPEQAILLIHQVMLKETIFDTDGLYFVWKYRDVLILFRSVLYVPQDACCCEISVRLTLKLWGGGCIYRLHVRMEDAKQTDGTEN